MTIIAERSFYVLVSSVALVSTLGYAVGVRRYTGQIRQYMLFAPFVTGLLALGYFSMSLELLTVADPEGEPVPISRFLVYFVTYGLVVAAAGVLADASRRLTAFGILGLVGFVSGTIINWLAPAPINSAGKLLVLSSLVGTLYVLLGPYTSAAQSVSGERRLLFGKLRNLMALLLLVYLIVGLTSRQGLGLLGTFTGVYLGGYMDLLGHLGFAGLLVRSPDAIEELARQHPSPLDYVRATHQPEPEGTASD